VLFEVLKRATTRGKKIWGRKRHLLVDTQGHLLQVRVTGAETSDLQGAKTMLEPLKQVLTDMKLLWGDSHYAGTLIDWLKEHLGWDVQVVRGLVTAKSTSQATTANEQKPEATGFHPLPRRWVVERSIAWITRWRRLCRDHEGLPQSSEAFIKLSAGRRMLSLLAPPFP
jgi:putative transposase